MKIHIIFLCLSRIIYLHKFFLFLFYFFSYLNIIIPLYFCCWFVAELTNGGVQQVPLEGYNTFIDVTTPVSYSSIGRWGEPYFDLMTPKNVTALAGKSAYLSCRVKNLGNKTVCKN